jgi:hypothetical protein
MALNYQDSAALMTDMTFSMGSIPEWLTILTGSVNPDTITLDAG